MQSELLDPEYMKFIQMQRAMQQRQEDPEYLAQRQQLASGNNDVGNAAAIAKSLSALGTLKGKSAPTEGYDMAADQAQKQQQAQLGEFNRREDQSNKQLGLQQNVMEYLQNLKEKKSARQDNLMAQTAAAQNKQQEAKEKLAFQQENDKRDRDFKLQLANIQNSGMGKVVPSVDKDGKPVNLVYDKAGNVKETVAGVPKANTADNAAKKSNQEADYRYISLRNNAQKLKDLIKTNGTNVLTGDAGTSMDSTIYEMAVDFAKLVDPDSVAREGEVASAKKYMLPFRENYGLTTSNDTAKDQIDNYIQTLDQRLAARKAAQVGNTKAITYQEPKADSSSGIVYAAEKNPNKITLTNGKEKYSIDRNNTAAIKAAMAEGFKEE